MYYARTTCQDNPDVLFIPLLFLGGVYDNIRVFRSFLVYGIIIVLHINYSVFACFVSHSQEPSKHLYSKVMSRPIQ